MYRKTYKVRVAMGDGNPIDDIVTAKNGTEAHDLVRMKHPAARAIYILGLAEKQLEFEHPFFPPEEQKVPAIPIEEESDRDRQIRWCLEMRSHGKSHRMIADTLGIGPTTVRRWLKQYG